MESCSNNDKPIGASPCRWFDSSEEGLGVYHHVCIFVEVFKTGGCGPRQRPDLC